MWQARHLDRRGTWPTPGATTPERDAAGANDQRSRAVKGTRCQHDRPAQAVCNVQSRHCVDSILDCNGVVTTRRLHRLFHWDHRQRDPAAVVTGERKIHDTVPAWESLVHTR